MEIVLLSGGIIRHNPLSPVQPIPEGTAKTAAPNKVQPAGRPASAAGMEVDLFEAQEQAMAYLSSRLFWDKKVKIAILALATFIAMC